MPNNLPLNWCECKLEDFVQILDGNRKPINSVEREQRIANAKMLYPYYGATGQVGYIDDYLIEGSYVLLGEDGAPFLEPFKKKAYIVDGKIWVNNHAHILKGYSGISDKFICYWLNSISYREYVSGTTRLKLNQAMMREIKCKLPPLAEQERIVAKIEALFQDIDEGVECLKSAQAQIKQYRQSVLKSAFDSKKLNIQKSLGDIIRIKSGDGLSSKNMDKNGEYPVFGGNGINGHHSTYNVSEQTIVIGRVGFYCGSVHITPNRAWITDNAFRVSFDVQKYDLKFIFWLLKNLNLNKYSVSTAQPVISGTKIYPIFTNVSEDKLEQQRIVEEIEKRFLVADELEKAVNEGLEKADRLKQSILKKAFEGKLVAQNPNDEPASVLLERIKKEQKPTKGKKK